MKKYRFSIDDNIYVFKDIAEKNYDSIFENSYLAMLKNIHEEYGTKIQLNIYYETDGFVLTDMPDRYKKEWEENAHWLRLSFHAYCDDSRYADSDYETLMHDCTLIHNEIIRFAGEKSLSFYTTLHYVACPKCGVLAMKDCGIKGLVGLYGTDEKPRLPYHLSSEDSAYMRKSENCFLKDDETGMVFMRNDVVLNSHPYDKIPLVLGEHEGSDFYEIMIHEQYYQTFFDNYMPDFADRIILAVKWLKDRGYEPAFFEEIFE